MILLRRNFYRQTFNLQCWPKQEHLSTAS